MKKKEPVLEMHAIQGETITEGVFQYYSFWMILVAVETIFKDAPKGIFVFPRFIYVLKIFLYKNRILCNREVCNH